MHIFNQNYELHVSGNIWVRIFRKVYDFYMILRCVFFLPDKFKQPLQVVFLRFAGKTYG